MKEADTLLNVPASVLERALEIEIPDETLEETLAAVNKGSEIIVLGANLYASDYFAVAIANHWAHQTIESAPYFSCADWARYRRRNLSPCTAFDSFREFLHSPQLLVISGLSFVAASRARQEIDTTLHRRAADSKATMITGWNMPPHEFRFELGQELAYDTESEYPMLHARVGVNDMVHYVEVPK